jgi:hypothetical protein
MNVTTVPPAVDPAEGVIPDTNMGLTYVKVLPSDNTRSPSNSSDSDTAPVADDAGDSHSKVLLSRTRAGTADDPNTQRAVGVFENETPLTTTRVPPRVLPEDGDASSNTLGSTKWNSKLPLDMSTPFIVTANDTAPTLTPDGDTQDSSVCDNTVAGIFESPKWQMAGTKFK